jgi:hypothetical protein
MSIEQEVDLLNAALQCVLNSAIDAEAIANRLMDYPPEDWDIKMQEVLDYAHDSLQQFQQGLSHLDTLQSLIGTNLFFVNAIQLGFPTKTALDLANVPGDSFILRNLITSLHELEGTTSLQDAKSARQQLSRVWTTIALGDQGELSVWQALLESGIPLENITIKPSLINQQGKAACPDFYCESENLICDAKAWKEIHSVTDLQQVVDKYAACFSNSGEVKLYFPKDIYQNSLPRLNKLSSPSQVVKLTILPMAHTYIELQQLRELFYLTLKSWQ